MINQEAFTPTVEGQSLVREAIYNALRGAPIGIGVEMWDDTLIDECRRRAATIAARAALNALREHGKEMGCE